MTLISYRRTGGPDPQSDEAVEVSESGEVTGRRVVATGRAGRFTSRLDPADLKSLEKVAAAIAGMAVDMEAPSRPPYEIEDIETRAVSLSFHPEQKLPRPVTTLRNRLRKLYEDLAEHPAAALEMAVHESGRSVQLRALGESVCEVDWTNASATWDLYDARQAYESSGQLDFGLERGRQELASGWTREARLDGVSFSPEKTLQVRFVFSMKFEDDRWRDCQLTAVAGKGW